MKKIIKPISSVFIALCFVFLQSAAQQQTDAQISFVTDAKGSVTNLILHQSGRDMPAQKSSKLEIAF